MKKVVTVNLHETHWLDDEIEIKAYYAGHVLGAAMFYVRVGTESIVYTGDYNMTPDRHLGSAWIDKVRPDVLVTETTYATTVRDSKRSRERDFLTKVYDCVTQGGKVIIPVFALGRAQELCILIETFWDRMGLKVPVYFSAGLTEKANNYYRLFINWTNQKIKDTYIHRNMFDFKHIKPWDRSFADQPGPMVLFATPGMLHIGTSLEVFKKWAHDRKNMVIMPGYCVAGTVGAKVLAGQKVIDLDNFNSIHVGLQVKNLSFSAHADAKGIMQLISQCEPRNVVLVHGEKTKMGYLKSKIMKEFGIPCFDPANGESIDIETSRAIP
ncbi:beta-lactamase-like protein, partial [Dimargaris cristalligena]